MSQKLEIVNRNVENMLREYLAARTKLTTGDLQNLLRILAKWRHQLVSSVLFTRDGLVVQGGPFAGMHFADRSTEGCYAARLLGCYEHELHGEIERLVARGFSTVLNIGCAEGYYAIGLARRMSSAQVFAHDTDLEAQAICRQLAQANGVAERIVIGGLFRGEDFSRFDATDTLLVMDIEGDEVKLLDPAAYPALRGMTVLVECHDGASAEIVQRFSGTHRIKQIENRLGAPELPECLQGLGHLDQLLAVWEWRSTPTPWLVMEPGPATAR
jgi:hypothetical protein